MGPPPPQVFYNPVQEFNRDLSICVIDQFAQLRQEEIRAGRLQKLRRRLVSLENLEKGIAAGRAVRGPDSELTPEARATRIEELRAKVQQQEQAVTNNAEPEDVDKLRVLEALSATGLRSMRYWAELGPNRLQTLVVNDLLDGAVTAIRRNIAFNGLPEDRVIARSVSFLCTPFRVCLRGFEIVLGIDRACPLPICRRIGIFRVHIRSPSPPLPSVCVGGWATPCRTIGRPPLQPR